MNYNWEKTNTIVHAGIRSLRVAGPLRVVAPRFLRAPERKLLELKLVALKLVEVKLQLVELKMLINIRSL